MHTTLRIDWFKGVDFKYDKFENVLVCLKIIVISADFKNYPSFSNFSTKNTQLRLLISNLRVSCFERNFVFLHIQEDWFQIGQWFFNFLPKQTEVSQFWCQVRGFFIFHKALRSDKFNSADLEHISSFLKLQPENYAFGSKVNFLSFWVKLCVLKGKDLKSKDVIFFCKLKR